MILRKRGSSVGNKVMPNEVNTYDLVSSDNLLIEEEALTALEEVLK
jgi:ribosomal protein L4